jgi:hypothetical protein
MSGTPICATIDLLMSAGHCALMTHLGEGANDLRRGRKGDEGVVQSLGVDIEADAVVRLRGEVLARDMGAKEGLEMRDDEVAKWAVH